MSQITDDTSETENSSSFIARLFEDCEPDERLNYLTRDAAQIFKVPIAMVNLVKPDHVMFKACVGLKQGDVAKCENTFCSRAIQHDEPYVVEDATKYPEFQSMPIVSGHHAIRSYAGANIHAPDGTIIGSFCLLDDKVRTFSRFELNRLKDFAELAEKQLVSISKYYRFGVTI